MSKLQDQDLFVLDSAGSSSVRTALQIAARPHPRKGSYGAPKTSDILAAAKPSRKASAPAVAPKKTGSSSSLREKRKVGLSRAEQDRLEKISGRLAKKGGRGLWDVSAKPVEEGLSYSVQHAGSYDVWGQEEAVAHHESIQDIVSRPQPKAPSTLGKHHLLNESNTPQSIATPHPGTSYNPTDSDHQALLRKALATEEATILQEAPSKRIKERMDAVRANSKIDKWQLAERDVGDGEEEDAVVPATAESSTIGADQEAVLRMLKKAASRRKTEKARRKRIDNIRAEKMAARARKIAKAQKAALSNLPSIMNELNSTTSATASRQQSNSDKLKRKLVSEGLTNRYSGPAKVSASKLDYQLPEELSEGGLRGLKPEGSLWTDWQTSAMQRGRLEASRMKHKRGDSKRRGRGYKEVERHDFKRFQ